MEYQYKLRPHHGLCISFFSVKKYSEKYKEHIKKIIAELENASIVCVTLQSDIFCEGCPSRLQDGSCSVADKVREYDQKILELCGWKEGMLLPYSEFKQDIHDNILSCRKCETICGDCEWSEICYINGRKNKKLICWINEQDKILSFHQEEGFVQKEFTDRDELRCFLLAVYGIYRIQ